MSDNQKKIKTTAILNFSGLILIIVLVNVIFSFYHGRYDLTEDKRYSLHPNTIELLQDDKRLQERIFFKIYLDGDLPADFKIIRNSIKNILDEFIAYAGDKVQYEFIDPNGSDDKMFNDVLKKNLFNNGKGILPTYLKSYDADNAEIQTIWPGAIVEYKGLTSDVIQFFDRPEVVMDENVKALVDQTINDLEYKIISSIRRVTKEKKSTVGFLQGHGELSKLEAFDVRMALEGDYIIGDVEINGQLDAFDGIDAIVIAKPKTMFSEKDKFIIDQYIMNGGKTFWLIDPVDVNRDSILLTGETLGLARNLNIEKDLLYKYGVRLNSDIVIDEQCTNELIPPTNIRIPGLPWVFYPLISPKTHPITNNLDPIKTEYTSSLTIVNENDTAVKKTILLESSPKSKSLMAPVRINYLFAQDQFKPDFSNTKFGNNPIAVLMEGSFSSPFENRISDAFLNDSDYKVKFKSKPTKMIVVSDGDIINSSYIYYDKGKRGLAPMPLNRDRLNVLTQNGSPKFNFGNKEFFMNGLDYLLGDNSLMGIRSKTITLRMLNDKKIKDEKTFWKTLNIIFPLAFIFILGIVQLIIRKKRFTS